MAKVPVPGLIGVSNTLLSRNADAEATINLFVESVSPGQSKVPRYLAPMPGIRPVLLWPHQPIRGQFFQDGRWFAVGGSVFAEIFPNYGLGPLFPLADDGQPVSICSNGTSDGAGDQLLICSGGLGYIYDLHANTLTQITAVGFPETVLMGDYLDGYFVVLKGGGSRRFQWSALEDGMAWDPLDFAQTTEGSDNLVTLIRSNRELWLLGTKHAEVWATSPDALNPFAPIQGAFLEQGSQASFAAARVGQTLIWLGLNEEGHGVIYRQVGYSPQRISTYAVELAIQRADTPTDARAWVYQENGHLFYVLVLPRGIPTSWVYDLSENTWQEKGTWDATDCAYIPHVAGTHVFAFDRHYVGDRFSGAIYHQSSAYFDEEIVAAT